MKLSSLSWTWLAGHNRQMARGLMLIATLCFGWRLAGVLWLATGQDQSPLAKPLPAPAAASTPNVDTSQLSTWSLFQKPQVAASVSADAPDTSLQLRLDGVFASSDTQRSGAIISEQGQPNGKLYGVGQSVTGGAILQAVLPDRVVLVRNGNQEILRFVKTSLLANQAPVTEEGSGKARLMLLRAVERMKQDPDAYVHEMGLVARDNAYEVTESAPADIRRGLGLKAGDKILQLNGYALGNPKEDRHVLEQAQQSGHVVVEVQRGSQTLTLEQNF